MSHRDGPPWREVREVREVTPEWNILKYVLPFERRIARHFPVLIHSLFLFLFLPKAVRPTNEEDCALHEQDFVTLGVLVCLRCFNYAMVASS